MIWIGTTWVQRSTRPCGDTSARFAVWYVRMYHTHLPGSYRSRSDILDMRRNPDTSLEFARVGVFIHFCFLLVSAGHHDAFVGYRVVIDRVCTRTLSHTSPTPLETAFAYVLVCIVRTSRSIRTCLRTSRGPVEEVRTCMRKLKLYVLVCVRGTD